MPNTGFQCPVCHAVSVNRRWTYGNSYLECTKCGWVWNG